VDRPLVRKSHDAEDAAAQLGDRCPETYPFVVGLALDVHGLLDDADAHLPRDVPALGEDLALEVCREGEEHTSSRLPGSPKGVEEVLARNPALRADRPQRGTFDGPVRGDLGSRRVRRELVDHPAMVASATVSLRDGALDLVTVAFGFRNLASYPAGLVEMRRVLKPGGHLVILDFSLPTGLLRVPYRFYLHRVLPHLAGWLTGHRDTYEYLGGSIEDFPSGTAMTGLLETCGFTETQAIPLTGGVVSIYQGSRPLLPFSQ